ncbi:UDP-glucose/GDP-mannose dehydrogenase family protein [Paraburkholderia sp. BR10872]|uniref:UDP-glucose/GDP-mannose dehydrogenase family protein n=1 Tax=Paraburkholderia sp. BR10872 TaxID=3236989 RepID=UPI0034D2FCCF
MKICVQGLWHLGSVTAACCASAGHDVIGLDTDEKTIDGLRAGKAPLFEPGLDALLSDGLSAGRLRFTTDTESAVADVDVLWVAFDTPVDDDDKADVDFVLGQIKSALPALRSRAVVLVSSQMPVGSMRALEKFAAEALPDKYFTFAYSPENLRLGKAIDVFLKPDRIVVGTNCPETRAALEGLVAPITDKVEWMSVESAEMTKHAINAFLAISVTFANEIASICEAVGADAKEVARGLKTETRIGPKAYVSPGGPFAGGTLARDIEFLGLASKASGLITPLLSSVRASNDEHKNWVRRKLLERFDRLQGRTVAIWGLTYKPGTDTLRRSLAVELCDWLLEQGAVVHVHDPVVRELPARWEGRVSNFTSAEDAVEDADALVVGTEWPIFRETGAKLQTSANGELLVIDANRHLESSLAASAVEYVAVGTSSHKH